MVYYILLYCEFANSKSGIITVKAKDAKAIMSALAKRKDRSNVRLGFHTLVAWLHGM